MADMGSLPDDLFMRIVLPFSMSSRRRLRLVCKRWGDIIDRAAPERHVRTNVLTFASRWGRNSSAVVFDVKDGSRRHEWTYPCSHKNICVELVGTCNGLLCLHEIMVSGNRKSTTLMVAVTNPITGETMALPPVPSTSWDHLSQQLMSQQYGFGYHPVTGQYKVVHIPCLQNEEVKSVQVFTLGSATSSWRDVPVLDPAGASYGRYRRIVSVDRTTYWLTACADRVMALDLEDERITSFSAMAAERPDATPTKDVHWMLTNIHAKLGLALDTWARVEVWVLESGGLQPRWSQVYNLTRGSLILNQGSLNLITSPHLTHGEYILSSSWEFSEKTTWSQLYRHKVGNLTGGDSKKRELQPSEWAKLIMRAEDSNGGGLNTFAYVETLEPLPLTNTLCDSTIMWC